MVLFVSLIALPLLIFYIESELINYVFGKEYDFEDEYFD